MQGSPQGVLMSHAPPREESQPCRWRFSRRHFAPALHKAVLLAEACLEERLSFFYQPTMQGMPAAPLSNQ